MTSYLSYSKLDFSLISYIGYMETYSGTIDENGIITGDLISSLEEKFVTGLVLS